MEDQILYATFVGFGILKKPYVWEHSAVVVSACNNPSSVFIGGFI